MLRVGAIAQQRAQYSPVRREVFELHTNQLAQPFSKPAAASSAASIFGCISAQERW